MTTLGGRVHILKLIPVIYLIISMLWSIWGISIPMLPGQTSTSFRNKSYGRNSERGNVLVRSTDGGFAMAGSAYKIGADNNDMGLIKTDVEGNVL